MKTENCRRKNIISICRFQPSVVGRLRLQLSVIKMVDFISWFIQSWMNWPGLKVRGEGRSLDCDKSNFEIFYKRLEFGGRQNQN